MGKLRLEHPISQFFFLSHPFFLKQIKLNYYSPETGNGTDVLTVTDFTISPSPVIKGKSVSVNATATLSKSEKKKKKKKRGREAEKIQKSKTKKLASVVSGGSVLATVYLNGNQLLQKNADICSISNSKYHCPYQPGPIEFADSHEVPMLMPKGSYTVVAVATNSNNEQIGCVKASVQVNDP